ncbi:MAG TPA: carbohydrate-binding protein, partial [Thermoanaerobaculia bacterium]
HDALLRTFDKYWEHALEPREYTPYEWRIVGSLIRLGEKDRALRLAHRFLHDQRPAAWNEWAEVVRPDPRKPGFIGDMPHTWVGSDFIRSMLDLFAYENDDGSLVIAAGIDEAWLDDGVTIDKLSTHYGPLGYSMRRSGDSVTIDFTRAPSPPGGVIVRSPRAAAIRSATADGQPAETQTNEIRLPRVPRSLVIRY